MYACVNEDGTAVGGGKAMPCGVAPCDECGALCPGSNWTPENAFDELDREYADYRRHLSETERRVALYRRRNAPPRCHICKRVMSDDPSSGDALNCGGDCAGCMREVERHHD